MHSAWVATLAHVLVCVFGSGPLALFWVGTLAWRRLPSQPGLRVRGSAALSASAWVGWEALVVVITLAGLQACCCGGVQPLEGAGGEGFIRALRAGALFSLLWGYWAAQRYGLQVCALSGLACQLCCLGWALAQAFGQPVILVGCLEIMLLGLLLAWLTAGGCLSAASLQAALLLLWVGAFAAALVALGWACGLASAGWWWVLVLKAFVPPLQATLAGIYQRLTLQMLCTYLALFYIPFVGCVLPLLLGNLVVLGAGPACFCSLVGLGVVTALSLQAEARGIASTLALSSLCALSLLLLLSVLA